MSSMEEVYEGCSHAELSTKHLSGALRPQVALGQSSSVGQSGGWDIGFKDIGWGPFHPSHKKFLKSLSSSSIP